MNKQKTKWEILQVELEQGKKGMNEKKSFLSCPICDCRLDALKIDLVYKTIEFGCSNCLSYTEDDD